MNLELRMKNLEARQNILEHIIRVLFNLFKSRIDKPVRIQIDNALLTMTDLKKASVPELQHEPN